jgi:molybdopterin-guanine dinucleotide biosynthesis protein A
LSLSRLDAEGFVLAGGKSSRMGQDKAFLEFCGRPLIQNALEIMNCAGLSSRIAGARSDLSDFAPVVPDLAEESGLGPLAGICAALSACTSRFAAFLPVDLPFIPASLIEYLVHHAVVAEAAVTVVSVGGFIHSFPAVVDRAAGALLNASLHSGDRSCLKAFRAIGSALPSGFSVLPVELLVQPGQVAHSRGMHPSQWFLNLNSPADLKQLHELANGAGRF